MLKSATQESEVIITQHLYAVAHHTSVAEAVLHKVYLHLTMPMHRICVMLLVAFYQMIAIFISQARYFRNNICARHFCFLFTIR